MPRKKRQTQEATPLQIWLRRIMKERNYSAKQLAAIASIPGAQLNPSVIHSWLQGAFPSSTVKNLRALCNHLGVSLSEALTGEPDAISLSASFEKAVLYEGLLEVKIMKVLPKK